MNREDNNDGAQICELTDVKNVGPEMCWEDQDITMGSLLSEGIF